jgi:hypothetical protein
MIPEVLKILFGAALTVVVSAAMGRALLGALRLKFRRSEEAVFSFVTGAACLSLTVFVLSAVHLARRGAFLILAAAALAAAWRWGGLRFTGETLPPLPRWLKILFAVPFVFFTYFYAANALAPEISPDGAGYHLGIVSRYAVAHGFLRSSTSMYWYLSHGMELLYLYAFPFGKHSAAAMVHFAFFLTLPFAIISYSRRFGFPVAGVLAAALVYFCPVAGFDGTTAYNDVAVACILFILFYLLEIWDQERLWALLVPIGLLAGFAYAVKYTAFLAVPYALGFVAWKLRREWRRAARPLAIVCVCAAVMSLPWMIKNWVWVDNPFSPFLNRVFPNQYVHIQFEQQYRESLANWGEIKHWWQIPIETAVRGEKLQGLLGPAFLLFPLALLALRRKEGRHALLAALVFGLTYPQNVGTRFLLSSVPFLALVIALAVEKWKAAAPAVLAFHAFTCWPTVVSKYCDQYAMHMAEIPLRAALRLEKPEDFLRRRSEGYDLALMLDKQVPLDSKVLCYSFSWQAYTSRDVVVGYEGAFNQNAINLLDSGVMSDWQPTRRYIFAFPPRKLRRIRILQTAAAKQENWSVNELRFYRGETELFREPQWRLTAQPNPWEIQAAFDNHPLTRWQSWEQLRPDMYVEVDFGEFKTVDRVVMDTTTDFWKAQFALESQGQKDWPWQPIPCAPSQKRIRKPDGVRRLATAELKWRGVEYLLIRDEDLVATDMHRDPAAWGVAQLAEKGQWRLYKIE